MAGKSTYLRTVGVNYLLACIGAPVWAKQMKIYPARLVTSLRTSDSLADNESYFFAELKRLKLIIDKLEAGEELSSSLMKYWKAPTPWTNRKALSPLSNNSCTWRQRYHRHPWLVIRDFNRVLPTKYPKLLFRSRHYQQWTHLLISNEKRSCSKHERLLLNEKNGDRRH